MLYSTRSEPHGRRGSRRLDLVGDRGQAVVEVALSLPLVCLVLLGVVQVAVVVRDQLLVDHLAREAARAGAVSAEPAAAARTAVQWHDSPGVEVTTEVEGHLVRVEVRRVNRTDVALIGLLLPDVTLHGSATMQREPP